MADLPDHNSELVADAILEDQLVDVWPEYPCLFDVRSSEFKNRDSREKALQEIATKLGQTVEWVKAKLKALRNAYTRVKKRPPSGSARKNLTKRASWLIEKLQFLSPFIATRAPISNLDSGNCDSQSETSINDQLDDENPDDDDSVSLTTTAETPSPHLDNEVEPCISRSTKEPTKFKPNRKRQADEEFKLIKGLTETIADRKNKKQMLNNPSTGPNEAFGRYVIQTLSELEPSVKHLAQYRINDILFQAQTGELTRNHMTATRAPVPTHQHNFQHVYPQYNMVSNNNQMRSNQQYDMLSQRDYGFIHNPQASVNMWSTLNQQLPTTTEPKSSQDQAIWNESSE